MSQISMFCFYCKHFQKEKTIYTDDDSDELTKYFCEAYPNGIPEAIFFTSHFYAKPNDNNLQFSPVKDKRAKALTRLKPKQDEEDAAYEFAKEYYSVSDKERGYVTD